MPTDTVTDRANLSAQIFAVIKDRIIRWEYPPGHRFTEQELCEEFDVSRSPIREALRMLVAATAHHHGMRATLEIRDPE